MEKNNTLVNNSVWLDFLSKAKRVPCDSRVLIIDPGDTSGYALFENYCLIEFGTIRNKQSLTIFYDFIKSVQPDIIVMEDYIIYKHKLQDHTWSNVPTIQYIGAIKLICELLHIPIILQTAQTANAFCTNKKLREWELYQKNKRHINDAIRHGCHFLLFGGKKK